MERSVRCLVASALLCGATEPALGQESFGRVDIRALRASNVVSYKAADTNVAIGLAAWRSENPRSMIIAQKPLGTNWSAVTFQFALQHDDSVTLILRGRYREDAAATNAPPEWVWVDNVSVTTPSGADLSRNGSFEKIHGFLGRAHREGQPEKWGYRGPNREIRQDAGFCQAGDRCLRVKWDVPAYQSFRAKSNTWYTVRAWFRAE
jgi:hypothetical protein